MAAVRIRRALTGYPDPLVAVGKIRPGDHVLDGTLGFGADALVAAAAAGPTGALVGIEASLALAAFVAEGYRTLGTPWATAGLVVTHDELGDYLRRTGVVFDLVVLDAMFSTPRKAHPTFDVLRRLACHRALDPGLVEQARGRARRAVVLKLRHAEELGAFDGAELVRLTRSAAYGVVPGAAGSGSPRSGGAVGLGAAIEKRASGGQGPLPRRT